MAVTIGSARIDENGHATGGKAGDQTGKEVSTQSWYKHSKGWRVFRCKDPDKAAKIASAMSAACKNAKIGYDQNQRLTLYNLAKNVGFDPGKVTTACETDCSALVRVCMAFAGIMVANFRTTDEAKIILASGMFVELTASKYTDGSAYLRKGDILVTKTQGHTVVVLTDGSKAEKNVPPAENIPTGHKLGERNLKKGDKGDDVREMQEMLMKLGFELPKFGADGDFGSETENAVIAFQKAVGVNASGKPIDVNGIFDQATYKAMINVFFRYVEITGGSVNVRKGPGTQYDVLGVVHKGDRLKYGGQTFDNGWFLVEYENQNASVSGKYGRLVE